LNSCLTYQKGSVLTTEYKPLLSFIKEFLIYKKY
jgi:hypothetical protein